MTRIVLASGNAGKLREISQLLEGSGFEVIAQNQLHVPAAVEDGLSFVENALIKARNACRYTGLAAIADDSGLEVAALDGRPGIHSARFAGPGADDGDNMVRLLEELQGVPAPQRRARFVCALVFLRHAVDPVPMICTGTWDGSILDRARGHNGFGYDPVFRVSGLDSSAAELSAGQKNSISHRARALACLREQLTRNLAQADSIRLST